MKERPIIFSGPMVLAILEGRKTQTRRVVKPQPNANLLSLYPYLRVDGGNLYFHKEKNKEMPMWKYHISCPYGQSGDRLYVRESFTYGTGPVDDSESTLDNSIILYRATWDGPDLRGCWKPSIHMPKWAARIWLEITDIRVERVQEINDFDAEAEGIKWDSIKDGRNRCEFPRDMFAELWDSINGKRPGCAWDDNPWVWVVEFQRAEVDK